MKIVVKTFFIVTFLLGVNYAISIINVKNEPSGLKKSFSINNYKLKRENGTFPLSINCENAQEGFLNFEGKVVAHSRFLENLKSNTLKIDLRKALNYTVERQLKYLDGFLDNNYGPFIRHVPHVEKEFKILVVEKIKYPTSIFLDPVLTDPLYYPKGSLNKWYKKGDSAYSVSYAARVKVTRCQKSKVKIMDKVDIILPLDPYLAYWFVPKNDRVEHIYHPTEKVVTTPCASKVMAHLKLPSMYWNTWMPNAKDKFDCKKFLQNDKHIFSVNSTFEPINKKKKEINYGFLKSKETILVSLVSGLLLPSKTSVNLDIARPLFNNYKNLHSMKFSDQDPAVLATLSFMELMEAHANNVSWSFIDNNDHFILSTTGELLHSKKKIKIDIYLGPSVSYQEGRLHWEFLSNAISNSDIIFYSGHAGMGETFSLENLRKNTKNVDMIRSPDHQIIGVLSCSSISYFGPDFVSERKGLGKITDFILTGFDDHSYKLTPAILQYIDLDLAGMNYSLKSIIETHIQNRHYDVHLTRE